MTVDGEIGWGILSTGGIARAFVEDLAHVPGARVHAVGSRSEEAARRFADAHGVPHAYGSWAELAADPGVDVVYVATPHSAHHAATLACLEAGRAVLCEKPFTINLRQARELVDTARRRGVFLMEAMWTYCNPLITRMVELIADGAIGEVRAVQSDFGIVGPPEVTHRLRDPHQGGGALLDLGVYPVSFAQLVLGPPQAIAAWASLTPEGVDETTGLVLGYDSGAVATLSCSIAASGTNNAVVSGTAGRIELPRGSFNPDRMVLERLGHEPEEIRPRVPKLGVGYGNEAEEVMRCLAAGALESSVVPLDRSLAVMATLDSVRELIKVRYPEELALGG
jgi:predicted dehydrogenase